MSTALSPNWLRWKFKRLAYPADWSTITEIVKRRANYRCEFCDARHRWFHPITGSIVFLQCAHLDHNVANCAFENLRALCQRCHLIYDAAHHAQQAYLSRRKGKAIRDLFD